MRSDRDNRSDTEREIDDFLSRFEDPADELSADYSSYLNEKNTTKMTAKQTFYWKNVDSPDLKKVSEKASGASEDTVVSAKEEPLPDNAAEVAAKEPAAEEPVVKEVPAKKGKKSSAKKKKKSKGKAAASAKTAAAAAGAESASEMTKGGKKPSKKSVKKPFGKISGILSCIRRSSSVGSLVSTAKTGSESSMRYNPASQVIEDPFGWIIYLSPVFF